MENTLQSWLDETLSKDNNANGAKSASEMMDLFALAKGIPEEVAAFLFGIRQAGAVGRSNAEENLDEFDHLPYRLQEGILDVLKKPAKAVSPRQKAFAWLHYVRSMETVRHLATLSLLKAPGCDDFRNLSPNAFSTVSSRPDGRTRVESFLRGRKADPRGTLAFLGAAAHPAQVFTPRQMLLYACAHCRSVERFAWILDKLRPKLGKADFVDALGYSPFFYTVLREDSIVAPDPDAKDAADNLEDDDPRPLTKPQMREFLDLLRKAGARPDRKCRFGFSWEDVEAVAEEYAAGQRPHVSWRRLEARKAASRKQRERYDPVPPPEEIRRLLADDPEKAFDAIERMEYLPESLERPFGPRERFVSDAICDRTLSKATRAKLLGNVVGNRAFGAAFDGLPPAEARDVPLGFLDSKAGRKWYCEHGRPGFGIVRCSDPAFFKNVAREDWSSDVDVDKVKIDPKLRKAIDADSPAQLMMQLSVSGKNVDARLLAVILTLRKTKILEWLLENAEKTKEFLDERRMLFYVCANWNGDKAITWLEKAEAKQPGIIKSCVDALGRNLLWYTQYNWQNGGAEETLLRHGCDPDAETVWGLSWRDMKAAR